MLYICLISVVTSSSVTSIKLHFVYGHFSGQEMLLPMNSDGTEVKIEVRENVFCVS